MRVLAGDIGGTKTRLAVFDVHGTRLETLTERSYPSGSYSGLETMPLKIIMNERSALYGPAFYLAALKEGTTGRTDG